MILSLSSTGRLKGNSVGHILQDHWLVVNHRDVRALGLFERHYSARHDARRRAGRRRAGFVGPGENLVLMTELCDALFVWRNERFRRDMQIGVNCAVFRNEGNILSSELIREAENWAWGKWPGERLFTFVDPRKVRSTNPGYCFLVAGWHRCGLTQTGLVILEKRANSECGGNT